MVLTHLTKPTNSLGCISLCHIIELHVSTWLDPLLRRRIHKSPQNNNLKVKHTNENAVIMCYESCSQSVRPIITFLFLLLLWVDGEKNVRSWSFKQFAYHKNSSVCSAATKRTWWGFGVQAPSSKLSFVLIKQTLPSACVLQEERVA